jgi:subtilisin family serine protease
MRLKIALLAGALGVALFALPAGGALSADATQAYIVQMLDQPAVLYTGGITGLSATKPAKGKKIDPNDANVRRYVDYLKGSHDKALERVGGGQKLYDYGFAFNGFAAVLTEAQAEEAKAAKNVVAVTPDSKELLDTFTTPNFLGLTGPTGYYQTTGSVGENVVIGVLDTGFNPENPAYSDRTGVNPNGKSGKLDYQQIPGWHGKCTPGEAFNASMCNQKVIGAQAFPEGALASGGIPDFEFLSPRDFDGHGSHTSTTAGGNFATPTDGDAKAAGLTAINGIAPRARLSIYKVCWELADLSNASCSSSDRVAATDQAVADGVDVLNHSIGATRTNFLDPVQIAFFNAAASGVFVAASAGNEGPGASTVASPGPWTTTVAASTHNRAGVGSVTLGNGSTFTGSSFNSTSTGSKPFIDSETAGLPGADATAVRLCFAAVDNGGVAVLDPAKVTGKIVLCDRGITARINKSLAVKEAGGVGMVLTNTALQGTNADLHFVPTVHLEVTDRASVKAYAATVGATATVNVAVVNFAAPAPAIAAFSSRGPILAGGGDILKPDLSAPGVDVLAAVTPVNNAGRNFDLLSGTSMSSPHVAGAAALLKSLHPSWSPMMIKSALMTSASNLLGTPNPFSQGAGHIDVTKAADPGLVFDSDFADWIAFICGTGQLTGSLCTTFGTIDPSDLNQASMAIGDLAGSQTVSRTVKSVGSQSENYEFSVEGLAGITATPSAANFTIAPGGSQAWTVTFARTTALLNAYSTGFLKWTGNKGHVVRMPVAIRPVAVAAPFEVTGTAGGISYNVKTGYSGTLNFAARGLDAPTETNASVAQDPDQSFDRDDPTGTFQASFVVPAGLSLLRVGIDEDFITPPGTDLDVYLFRGATFVGQAADGDSDEMVTLASPTAGTYTVFVHGFATNGPSADFRLFEWQVPTTSASNMNVPTPAAATIGGTVPVNLTFTGLAAGTWYLGQVVYNDGSANVGSTIVNVR